MQRPTNRHHTHQSLTSTRNVSERTMGCQQREWLGLREDFGSGSISRRSRIKKSPPPRRVVSSAVFAAELPVRNILKDTLARETLGLTNTAKILSAGLEGVLESIPAPAFTTSGWAPEGIARWILAMKSNQHTPSPTRLISSQSSLNVS